MSCLCSSKVDNGELNLTLDRRVEMKEKPSVPKKKNTLVNPNTILEIEPERELKKQITFKPKVDIIYDSEQNQVILVLDTPGFKVDDLDIEIGDGLLTVSGPRSNSELYDTYGDSLVLHAKERDIGFFKRLFKLPNNILDDTAEAVYKNGILEIKMKCKQFSNMHKVDISVA